jgi:hypothetical protein
MNEPGEPRDQRPITDFIWSVDPEDQAQRPVNRGRPVKRTTWLFRAAGARDGYEPGTADIPGITEDPDAHGFQAEELSDQTAWRDAHPGFRGALARRRSAANIQADEPGFKNPPEARERQASGADADREAGS